MVRKRPEGPDLARRTLVLVIAAAVLGAPALVLRLTCAGRSCEEPAARAAEAPFCSLSAETRGLIAAGFREGRSPDVLAVTARDRIGWPSAAARPSAEVPLVFSGSGVAGAGGEAVVELADVAPTIAAILGFERPHPEVRAGSEIEGVAAGAAPRLVVLVVWKGVTAAAVRRAATPVFDRLASTGAAFTAAVGSEPLEPIAAAATIGSGGLPRQHGITGRFLRNDDGELVGAWSKRAPVPVIAALGDDLDHAHGGRARIGLVSADPADRGLIGGTWYLGSDDDDIRIARERDHLRHIRQLLKSGYGADEVPDLLAVAAAGSPEELDVALGRIAATAGRDGALVVVGTGGSARLGAPTPRAVGGLLEEELGPVVERVGAGGLFLDHDVLAERALSEQRIADALLSMRGPDGKRIFVDAFPAVAVSFARYC